MKNRHLIPMRLFALLAVLAFSSPLLRAQAKDAKAPAKPAPAATNGSQAANSGGVAEGIKVHGHWIIEVRNPDGTLVTRREFDNRLVDASLLTRVLTRKTQDLGWIVEVIPCCAMVEADFLDQALPNNAWSKTLTVTAPTGPQAGQLILFGSVTAQSNIQVTKVATRILTGYTGGPFTPGPVSEVLTDAPIPQGPINVVQGQVFTVSVTLTFS